MLRDSSNTGWFPPALLPLLKRKRKVNMSRLPSVQGAQRQMTPVILSSMLGTAIEWYDFFLYGTMATLVFPKLFFPKADPVVGTLLSLLTFLVGFIARPRRGACFAHLCDRIRWTSNLIATSLLKSI